MDLSALPWGILTPSGLLAFTVGLILSGRLVPISTVRQIERDRDYWRTIAYKALGVSERLAEPVEKTAEVLQRVAEKAEAK